MLTSYCYVVTLTDEDCSVLVSVHGNLESAHDRFIELVYYPGDGPDELYPPSDALENTKTRKLLCDDKTSERRIALWRVPVEE